MSVCQSCRKQRKQILSKRLQINLRFDNEPEHSRSCEEQSSRSSPLPSTVLCWLLRNLRDRWQAPIDSVKMLKLIGNLESRINQLEQELKELKQN